MSKTDSLAGARHTLVFPYGLFVLAKAWSKAEKRTVGSVLTYALETGFRKLLKDGTIPKSAIDAYQAYQGVNSK
jgi:hypothetical protein